MEIKTERLVLRDFVSEDWRAVYSFQNDVRYLEYYEWTHRTEPEVKAFVNRFIEQQRQQPRFKYQFAMTLKESGKLIGDVGIRRANAEARVADLGYELDPRYWGNGYATEAARAMLEFGFEQLHLHRVWAQCVADNVSSAHILEKIGMRQEGRLRENEHFKRRWWDVLVYGILEDEWRWQAAKRG